MDVDSLSAIYSNVMHQLVEVWLLDLDWVLDGVAGFEQCKVFLREVDVITLHCTRCESFFDTMGARDLAVKYKVS